MKYVITTTVLIILFTACRKKEPGNNGGGVVVNPPDTAYVPPANITRYTRQMAGTWHWKGSYIDHSVYHDSEGTFELMVVNDSTLKFRGSTFCYELRSPHTDSNFLISYNDTSFKGSTRDVAGIHFYYKDDTIVYNRWWGPDYRLRLYAKIN